MSTTVIILLGLLLGLLLCLNPLGRRPPHVRRRNAYKRVAANRPINKWDVG